MSTDSENFVNALEVARNTATAMAVDLYNGPVLPIFSIDFRKMPTCVAEATRSLIVDLQASSAALDRGPSSARGDGAIGAMRQIHTNNPRYLPRNTVDFGDDRNPFGDLEGRSRVYAAYTKKNKKHTNDRRDDAVDTGYVEYTGGNSNIYPSAHLSEMRVVFDYIRGRIFLSPFHYQSWTWKSGKFEVIDKPAAESGHPNPFYWIVEIPKKT